MTVPFPNAQRQSRGPLARRPHAPATPSFEPRESTEGRDSFELLITDLLGWFGETDDSAVEQAIAGALERLGRFLDVERVTLSEADAHTFHVVHSWAAAGAAPIAKTFKATDVPWYARQLWRGETVSVARLEDLPREATHERAMMRRLGTRSLLTIPLIVGHGVVGALALGALGHERRWPDRLVRRLRLVGQIFAAALGRKQASERMAQQQQELAHVGRVAAVGELAAILAHDLNQPLTAILTNAQATRRLLEQGRADERETDEALADIAHDANRAGEIIRRLRALLRKGEPSLSVVDLRRTLGELEPIIAAELREYEVALKLELSDGLPPVKADGVQLQQVLLNLVSNACHAMAAIPRAQRELVVRTSRGRGAGDEDMVLLEVRDGGPPIPRAVFTRIFEPYFTTKATGLGMGLAISRAIVAAGRGRVWASQNEGRGITVHVALPACP